MIRSILLALEDSVYSRAATELGLQWSARFNSLLVGLGVINDQAVRGPVPQNATAREAFEKLVLETRQQTEQLLDAFAERAKNEQITAEVREDAGYPADVICREAQRCDLILIGQRTRFHPQMQQPESETLHKVLACAPRPVVAVPDKLPDGSGVLIGYDGSPQAARTVQMFVYSGLHVLGQVRVVSIDSESAARAGRVASQATEFLRRHEIDAHSVPIQSYDPPGEILVAEAIRHGVGLLAMGVYGQPKFKELLLGSVTTTALDNSPVPLFLYH